jgi:ubiquinone/menaquinone biosynthesis C-methylase UbiE
MQAAADAAIRAAWDAVATDYARLLPDMSIEAPLVAEVGCGAGRVTRHLHDMGLRMLGLDLSPAMAAVAQSSHANLPFAAADARALPLRDGVLGGLVAWYSLINMPTTSLAAVFAEFARVTRPGSPVLVALQSGGGERVDRTTSYGRPVLLTYYRHRADEVSEALTGAGFTLYASVERAAALSFESTSQAALLAHREQR